MKINIMNTLRSASASSNRWGGGVYSRLLIAGFLCFSVTHTVLATTWTYTAWEKASGNIIGTITDGQWTLKVNSFDKTAGTIKLGNNSQTAISDWSEPSDTTLSGILDLRSPLVIKEGETETTIQSVLLNQSAIVHASLTEFYCDIVGSMGNSCFASNEKMTTIEISGTAETIPSLLLNRCSSLKTIKFNFPNMRKIDGNGGQSFLGVSTTPDPIDIATVATPGVTAVVKNALASGKLYGDLTLTNVMELGEYAFNGAYLTNVFLAGSLEILPNAVFKGSSITNLVLDLPNLTTVAIGAFTSQTQIRRVELVTAFKDMVILTNIVAAAAAGTANLGENGYMVYDEAQKKNVWLPNNLRVYVSKKQWTPSAAETYDADTNPTGFFQGSETFTDKEKKLIAADPTLENAFGVLITKGKKSNAEVVVRKAFLVHKPSIHDKSGTLISVR